MNISGMSKLSIIVPVYNSEKYLKRCVESILSQTFRDFEIILIDDGSKDGSGGMCDDYSRRFGNIHTIHQKNSGAATARNTGIDWVKKNSKSRYISFIDADDWVHPEMLEILIRNSDEEKNRMVVCGYMITEKYSENFSECECKCVKYSPPDFLIERSNVCHMPVCKLLDVRLFESYRFPDGKLYEDVFLMYKLFYACDEILFIDFPLYFYFKNPESSMNSSYSLRKLDEVEAGEEQVEFFKEKNDERNLTEAYKRLMYYYSEHTRKLRQLPGGKPYAAKLKRKLARLLLTKAKACKVSIRSDTQYYETAFPLFMFFYWRFRKLSGIFSKKKS